MIYHEFFVNIKILIFQGDLIWDFQIFLYLKSEPIFNKVGCTMCFGDDASNSTQDNEALSSQTGRAHASHGRRYRSDMKHSCLGITSPFALVLSPSLCIPHSLAPPVFNVWRLRSIETAGSHNGQNPVALRFSSQTHTCPHFIHTSSSLHLSRRRVDTQMYSTHVS